jgi:hypothetical protein
LGPVHAWATRFTYQLEKARTGKGRIAWLERNFQKLLLNFTRWLNRKDRVGNNAFEGGFLRLDNIGVFDRSAPLPTGGHLALDNIDLSLIFGQCRECASLHCRCGTFQQMNAAYTTPVKNPRPTRTKVVADKLDLRPFDSNV